MVSMPFFVNCPKPGIPKIISTKMAPFTIEISMSPAEVITGVRTGRSIWREMTMRSGIPLARAVRTYSSPITSSMAARVALARRVDRLPRLKEAIEAGAVGFESATLLARVATPSTEAAWLALADISTTKIFREHVDAAELQVPSQRIAARCAPTSD